jgi:biopolymer transport protein ExbD
MAKFKKKSKASQEIPTAALPDIIFMLLFFFMVTTVMRENTLKVEQRIPPATQLKKIERKSLITYMYVGKPIQQLREKFGSEPLIQVNDVFIDVSEIVQFVEEERGKMDEVERDQMIVSLKVDKDTKMGIIGDIKQELREANSRLLNYSSRLRVAN